MGLVVTLNGTTPLAVRDLNLSAAQNNQDTLQLTVRTTAPATLVDIDDEITVVEDGTETLYGGTVKRVEVRGYGDSMSEKKLTLDLTDYNELALRQIVFALTIPGGTLLKDAVATALEHVEGVTRDDTLWNLYGGNPSIGGDDLTFDEVTPDAIFKALAQRTGWLHNIHYGKKVWFYQPGTWPAPWNVSDGDGNTIGDIITARSRDKYYNKLLVKYSEYARAAYAFLSTTGNFSNGEELEVAGQTYTWRPSPSADGEVPIGVDAETSLESLITIINSGDTFNDAHTVVTAFKQSASMMRITALTPGASGNSVAVGEGATPCANAAWITEGGGGTSTLTFGFDEGLSGRVIVEDPAEQIANGIYTGIIEAVDCFNDTAARNLGTLVLAVSTIVQYEVGYTTTRTGLYPGMTQTVQASSNGAPFDSPASCLITEVNTRMLNEGALLSRTVTLVYPDNVFKGTEWREFWSGKVSGGGVSATSVSGGGGGGGITPPAIAGVPVYLLQGDPSIWVQSSGPTWVPAAGSSAGEGGIEYEIDTTVRGSSTGRVYVRLRAASGSVQARLYDVANAAAVGTSVAITNTSFEWTSFEVTLTTGSGRYRLELLPSVADTDVCGVGYLL